MSEEFELELSSFSNRIDVFCLLIWRCLNVKSSLSRTDGSEGKVYKKVTVANLALCEKNGRSNPALGGAFLHSFGLGGGNLNEPILKGQMHGGLPGRGCRSFKLMTHNS